MNLKHNAYSLLLGLSCIAASAAHAQSNIVYQEDWSGYTDGASIIGNGYRFANTVAPAGNNARNNSAIVHHNQNGNYVSITSHGFANINGQNPGWSPRVVSQNVTSSSPIALSASAASIISVDIRYRTPGFDVKGPSEPYSSFRFSGDGGSAWIGFLSPTRLFANLPGQSQVTYDLSTPINMDVWYRFAVELNPNSQAMVLRVFELDALGNESILWTTTSTSTAQFSTITSYTMELARAGTTNTNVWSADFGNITVATVPEPATMASLFGAGALLLALGIRSARRRKSALSA